MDRIPLNYDSLTDLRKELISAKAYAILHATVTSIALRCTGELEAARDIASECLVTCWEGSGKMNSKTGRQYLHNIVENYCRKYHSATHTRSMAEGQVMEDWVRNGKSDAKLVAGYTEDLLQLTVHLEPYLKKVAELSLVHELSLHVIAGMVNKSFGTVSDARDLAVYHLKRMVQLQKGYNK